MSDLRMNIGSLRSTMELTLHTHHAARIWHGRTRTEAQPAIIGLSAFVSIMARMRRGSQQDDPYSDWWMIRVEEKLDDVKTRLEALKDQGSAVLARLPRGMSVSENLSVQPVKLPIFISSQHGFLATYLLSDFDDLARQLLLAHHAALIDRPTMERWIKEGAHLLRSTFSLAQRYRFSGASRDDFAANNAVARSALERFGELPQDVLEGTRRPRFAPPIIRRSGLASDRSGPIGIVAAPADSEVFDQSNIAAEGIDELCSDL